MNDIMNAHNNEYNKYLDAQSFKSLSSKMKEVNTLEKDQHEKSLHFNTSKSLNLEELSHFEQNEEQAKDIYSDNSVL